MPNLRTPLLKYELLSRDLLMLNGGLTQQYILRVKDLSSEDKPREKLLQLGPKSLNLTEIIAILWGVGTKKEELLNMAQRLTKEYGEKALLHENNPQKLAEILDIPLTKACQIVVG